MPSVVTKMPNVTTLLSGGVSVGLLAGVVSGLFYLVVAGIRWAGKLRSAPNHEKQQHWSQGNAKGKEGQGCSATPTVCPGCSNAREVKLQSGEWFYRQVQRRFQATAIEHNKHTCDNGVGMDPESIQVREFIERLVESLVSGGLDDVCIKRLHSHPEYDRMFACHHAPLCEALARLSFTLQMAISNKPMPEQESPSSAHSALKQLIQQIIQEAMTLPTLQGLDHTAYHENGLPAEDINSKTYEDILATAILNKVIQRYQKSDIVHKGGLDGNSNLLESNMEEKPKFISRIEIGVNSSDSLEEESLLSSYQSDDCNFKETVTNDPLSFTIEECIEEVTTFSSAEEEDLDTGEDKMNFYVPGLDFIQRHRVPFPELGMDIVEGTPLDSSYREDVEELNENERNFPNPTDLVSPVDSWEENWLFQRRRLKTGNAPQPMPVPMLVPNPSEDYRALIGDRDAEEISDLSECSDSVLEDLVLADEDNDEGKKNEQTVCSSESQENLQQKQDQPAEMDILTENIQCKNVIVQKVSTSPAKTDAESSEPSEIAMEYSSLSEEKLELLEAKNVELYKSSSVDCLSELGQQDSEYTEDYATVTQRQMDSLSAGSEQDVPSGPETISSQEEPTVQPTEFKEDEELQMPEVQALAELSVPPRPGTKQSDDEYCTLPGTGTIAEREHKKWETAPPLPNNPYSSENISKRLSKKPQYSSRNSNGDISLDFPEFKSEQIVANIEKPLHIVCAPSDLDCKRYGRDYYINSKSTASNECQAQQVPNAKCISESSPQISQLENPSKKTSEVSSGGAHSSNMDEDNEDKNKIQAPNLVENEIARLQKEIDQSEQWYKSLLSTKTNSTHQSQANKTDKNYEQFQDLHKFRKVIIKDDDVVNNKPLYANTPKVVNQRKEMPSEKMRHGPLCENTSAQLNYPGINEQRRNPELHNVIRNGDTKCGRKHLIDDNYIEMCINGSGRSDSPSEGSIASSDSEFSNLPSVKELTKRFSSMGDSDSSTSTPKCPSPAPRWRTQKQQPEPMERLLLKREHLNVDNSLDPNRQVREVHSLTARSISREFREGLRRNQPLHLDRNVYNQSGSYASLTTSSNGEGSSTPSSSSDDAENIHLVQTKLIPRSMRSNIAFWEQMQHNKL